MASFVGAIKNLTAQYFSVLLIFRVDGHTAYHANLSYQPTALRMQRGCRSLASEEDG
ncbi:hypothetical protein L917_06689 [Phytophthora nicotianae]|uniref:Uncharacterized protein n=1 Tax=Phytophthora nicotianae TaxID=4792 RepID=W2LDP8_PHYNI|nr:hypothetical protein L917_06689 [Phytophthora nicotianae]